MSDLSRIIIDAASSQLEQEIDDPIENSIEELFEDEPEPVAEMKREIVREVINEPQTQAEVKRTQSDIDADGYWDPEEDRARPKSAEAEMQDRLLTIPRRPKGAPWGSLWVIHTGFIEQIALLNITKSEQRGLLRQWADIQVLSEGDGNADIVESEQDEFMLKIVSYKSRSDNPEKGIRERTAHITNKTITDQTVQMPKSETQRSGFLNTILGRKIQQ
jgi:hypothetical protein